MEYNSEEVNGGSNGDAANGGDKGTEDERKVFVGGLSQQTFANDFRTYFEKFGAIEKATLKTDSMTGASRGFGFILFEDKSSVEGVMAETNHSLGGKKIGPRRAKPAPKPEPILKVFVGGVGSVPEETVKSHFEQFGTVEEVVFPINKETNERKNFAFVKFESEDVVNACVAINNSAGKQSIAGTDYDVKKATPRDQGGRGGGRGGRGGGGRGGFGGGYGGGGYGAPGGYGGGYGGGYEDYSGGYGGGYGGGYDYSQDYSGGYGGGYGAPAYGKAPRGARGGRGRGRGYAPY